VGKEVEEEEKVEMEEVEELDRKLERERIG